MSAFSSATVAGAEAVSGTGKKSSSSKVISTRKGLIFQPIRSEKTVLSRF